jgi:hypothetical protein
LPVNRKVRLFFPSLSPPTNFLCFSLSLDQLKVCKTRLLSRLTWTLLLRRQIFTSQPRSRIS